MQQSKKTLKVTSFFELKKNRKIRILEHCSQRSPDPLAGGEGADCPLPKNSTPACAPQTSVLQAEVSLASVEKNPGYDTGADVDIGVSYLQYVNTHEIAPLKLRPYDAIETLLLLLLLFAHNNKAAGVKTKQSVKQRLQRLLIRCSSC